MVYSQNGKPHNNQNQQNMCNNVDKFHKVEQKKKEYMKKKKRVYVLHDFTYINIRSRQNQYILMTTIRGWGLGLVIRRKQDRGSQGDGNILFLFLHTDYMMVFICDNSLKYILFF